MKRSIVLTLFAALFAISSFCDEGLSNPFSFRSKSDMDQAVTLKSTDPIYYSEDLAEGEPVSVVIIIRDMDNPVYEATLMTLLAPYEDGTFLWDYYAPEFRNLPAGHTYLITETITTDTETKTFSHTIKIVPEPVAIIALAAAGFLFFRKRMRSLLSVVVALSVIGVFSAKAEGIVGEVTAQQLFPFERTVVVNYTLESDENDEFTVDFFCTPDNGETFYKLSEYGTLSGEGAEGTVTGNGRHKIYWTPGEAFDEIGSESMMVKVAAEVVPPPPKTFMTIDLSDGSVSYSPEPPASWTAEYKTTKLALRRIEPGTFLMGSPEDFDMRGDTDLAQHEVTLTKPYYIGVFEVTQAQYELITGTNPSQTQGATRPVETVNFNTITGANGFFQQLNAKTGLSFGLPTEAQWEMACRAGTTTSLNNGTDIQTSDWDPNLAQLGRYPSDNNDNKPTQDYNGCHTVVGSYLPNAWGLYDMHGNVYEWCLDWIDNSHLHDTDPTVDEVGTLTGNYATIRGGSWGTIGKSCCSGSRSVQVKSLASSNRMSNKIGFRVFMQLD